MTPVLQNRHQLTKRANWVSTLNNGFLAFIKITLGLLGHSSALFADGIHSLADLLCNTMVFVANHYSHLDPDENHPYGHWRFETVATFALGLFLVIVGLSIGYDSIHQILHHTIDKPDQFTIWVAVVSILANECVFRYSIAIANRIHSDLLRANAWHSRSDSWASLIVLAGLLGSLAGFPFLDKVAALVVAFFIIRMGSSWGWKAIEELSDAGLSSEEVKEVEAAIMGLPGVKHLHQLRTRKMAGRVFLDVHILIEPHYLSASEGHYIGQSVQVTLSNNFPDIKDVTIHIDTENHPEGLPEHLLPDRVTIIDGLMPKWRTILAEAMISRVILYYFQNHIEITLQLSLNVLAERSHEQLKAQFSASLLDHPYVSSIVLVYG
ncbi:MAG: cation diffusion facilitator family transporter [Gammaproteobacteria bacterium]|nr:cation diffusion facilitator family transporter [Gammaproteobacteria bacterium]